MDKHSMESRYRTIEWQRRGRILTLALNRPDSLNAVNAELHHELAQVFRDAEADEGSDVIILTGNGRAFSAGGDASMMKQGSESGKGMPISAVEGKQIIFSMLDCEKPIIAKINGHAMGLGATMALFADVIYMAEGALIGDPHVSMGLVAGDGGAVIWPALIGVARAKEFLMTGDRLNAQEAHRLGLVNHICAPEALDAEVDKFADRLAGGALLAIKWTKTAVNIPLKQIAHAVMDVGLGYETVTMASKDHKEAVMAFLEKRKPKFTGR